MPVFACKAFCCKAMVQLVREEGLGLDVVSGGELHTALSAGFPAKDIFFHGNNKTADELAYAVSSGVGHIVVDNIFELELLNQIAAASGKKASIMFRVKPGVDANNHDFVKTGCIDSKFGFALETGEAFEAVKAAVTMEHLHLDGLHCHIGSQIFDIEPFELAARVMLELIAKVKRELGHEIATLNLGGGFGIQYIPEHDPAEYERYMKKVSAVVREACAELDVKTPFIVIEPGRSIVGSAGGPCTGGRREGDSRRAHLCLCGRRHDGNPRYALYKSQYFMLMANKATQPKTRAVTVAGRCCESGDLLGENVPIQEPLWANAGRACHRRV
jgi:diaminopimelate decarboxylase